MVGVTRGGSSDPGADNGGEARGGVDATFMMSCLVFVMLAVEG